MTHRWFNNKFPQLCSTHKLHWVNYFLANNIFVIWKMCLQINSQADANFSCGRGYGKKGMLQEIRFKPKSLIFMRHMVLGSGYKHYFHFFILTIQAVWNYF